MSDKGGMRQKAACRREVSRDCVPIWTADRRGLVDELPSVGRQGHRKERGFSGNAPNS